MTAAKAKRRRPARKRSSSLQGKMTAMLLAIVLQSVLLTGAIMAVGSIYLANFNTIMNDCYDINQILVTYTREISAFDTYVLSRDSLDLERYMLARQASDEAQAATDISFRKSQEQHLMLQAIRRSFDTFRTAADETLSLRYLDRSYAQPYERTHSIGQYIEGYIKDLLQLAISQGQEIYHDNTVKFRLLPVLFMVSVSLSLISIVIWTRWMVKRVVSPINDLIRVAGDMRANQYDTPDITVYQEDEIARLAKVVNEMKRSTLQLVDSLRTQQEIESRLHAEELHRIKMDAAMDTLRLSLLQSQINPHFLFNTLNIISRMALLENAPTTEDLIIRLANLFRYNLQSVDDVVPLENELKIVEDYITIQRIRFGERIAFELRCEVDPAQYTVPVFTMQPLIENAVIHGLSPMEEGGKVTVSITRGEGVLRIAVCDTGVGMTPEQRDHLLAGDGLRRTHVSGLGVGNVRNRIVAHYPGSTFTIESRLDEGTDILITIPLEVEEISEEIS